MRSYAGLAGTVDDCCRQREANAASCVCDAMVLQEWKEGDARSFVNGAAEPFEQVSLDVTNTQTGYHKTYLTDASSNGEWSIQLNGTCIADDDKAHIQHYGPANFTSTNTKRQKDHS